MNILTPEETGKLYDAIVREGSKCGFYPKITRNDPRGCEYGYYEAEPDDRLGMVRVFYYDRNGSVRYSMLFESPDGFRTWAREAL